MAHEPEFTPGEHGRIIFAHSFGLHLCDPEILDHADLLVLFGGFRSFHPQAARLRRRSQLVLRQMINRMEEAPHQVLKDFYRNVFSPHEGWPPPEGALNRRLLQDDLKRLNESKIASEQLNKVPKICILHGSRDAIVPCIIGRELHDELYPGSNYLEIKQAGHALPFTHTEQSWLFIKSEIEKIILNYG